MARMCNRFGRWWQLWMTLAVMWTIAVVLYGWIDLPRAPQMPHDPQFLSRLSHEASSILFGTDAQAKPVASGALVWSDVPRLVSMPNGMRLAFPGATTSQQAAFFASEYRQLLDVKAAEQRGPYLVEMFAIWLAPLLVAGLAASLISRGYKPLLSRVIRGGHPPSSARRAVASASAINGTANRVDGDTTVTRTARFPCRA